MSEKPSVKSGMASKDKYINITQGGKQGQGLDDDPAWWGDDEDRN